MKNAIRLFLAVIMIFESGFAGGKPTKTQKWIDFEEERIDITLSLIMLKFQGIKKPSEVPNAFLQHLSPTEMAGAEKAFSHYKKMPTIKRDGKTLIFEDGKETLTLEFVNLTERKFKINGRNLFLDPARPFNDQIHYLQQRYGSKDYSLLGLFLSEAHANPVLIGVLLAAVSALFAVLGNVGLLAICRKAGLNGGPCGGVEDSKFDNMCVSKDGKNLQYYVKKPVSGTNSKESWTALAATLQDGKVTQITQLYLEEEKPPEKPTQAASQRRSAASSSKTSADSESGTPPKNPDLKRKGLPIIYTLKDGELEKVEIPGRTIYEKDLPKTKNGEPNPEWFAYNQMKGLVRGMVNFCRDNGGKFGDWDDVVIPVANTIDDINKKSGSTDTKQAITPDEVDPNAIKTVDKAKQEQAEKNRQQTYR